MKFTFLLKIPILKDLLVFIYRLKFIIIEISVKIYLSVIWLFSSKEVTNFTYDLTELNKVYLAQTIAHITKKSYTLIKNYLSEIESDEDLKKHIYLETKRSGQKFKSNTKVYFGRRIGWYAIVRAIKPKIIVETGVDKGLGSCILTSALMKNKSEGYPGYYYGTDINPKAGFLLTKKYSKYGEILFGDSIESLKKLNKKIDLFINDSDHSAEYEYNEYLVIKSKLNKSNIILGDNSDCSSALFDFSLKFKRNFLFFSEIPKNYFKKGAGIGFSYVFKKG